MDPAILKDWLVPASTVITLLSAAIGILLAVREYRLKLQAETRLKYSSQVEVDIKLLQVFTEIMNIAHARGGMHVSEKAVELLLQPKILEQLGKNQPVDVSALLEANAVIRLPVGMAAQDAAIAAIAVLGKRHEILREVSLQALESLCGFKSEIATKYLDELKSSTNQAK